MAIKASVKKGFGVARQSMVVVGILSLFGFIWNLINLYYAPKMQQETPDTATAVGIVVATIIFILASIFLQAGSLGYVRDMIKQGKAELSSFISAGGKYYLPIFLVGLIITVVALLFILVAAALVAMLKTVGIVIAVIVAVVAVYLLLLVFFAPYVVVINEAGPIAAIKKSMGLVKKNILSVLGIALILILIGFVIGLLTGVLLGILNVAAPGPVSQVAYALISSILNSFLGLFVTASFMSYYLTLSNTQGV